MPGYGVIWGVAGQGGGVVYVYLVCVNVHYVHVTYVCLCSLYFYLLYILCHQLLLLVNSVPLGLAVRACRLHPQGVTAVVHGSLFMHWAISWVENVGDTFNSPHWGGYSDSKYTTSFLNTLLFPIQMIQL